jgi:hypothetical protein
MTFCVVVKLLLNFPFHYDRKNLFGYFVNYFKISIDDVFMGGCIFIIDHYMMQNDRETVWAFQIKKQKSLPQIQNTNTNNHHQYSLLLNDISPIWAMRLKEKGSPLFLLSLTRFRWIFQILHPKKCVVAEAYGFSSSYTNDCAQCARIGNKFSLYYALNFSKKLEDNQNKFVKHWNEKHLDNYLST